MNQNPNTPEASRGVMGLMDYYDLSQLSDQELTNLFGVRDFFVQELDFSALAAAGGTGSQSFTVQNDANFLWQEATMQADVAAAVLTQSTNTVPLIVCTILDSSSGRQLMQAPVPVTNIFGTAQLPFVLPTPRFFRANTQVTVSVQNNTVGTVYNLKLSFIGTKFFKYAQPL